MLGALFTLILLAGPGASDGPDFTGAVFVASTGNIMVFWKEEEHVFIVGEFYLDDDAGRRGLINPRTGLPVPSGTWMFDLSTRWWSKVHVPEY